MSDFQKRKAIADDLAENDVEQLLVTIAVVKIGEAVGALIPLGATREELIEVLDDCIEDVKRFSSLIDTLKPEPS